MSLDYNKLVPSGRAHSMGRPWNDEEHAALIEISRELGLKFFALAPYIRDGVRTVEEYLAAKEKGASNEVVVKDGLPIVEPVKESKKEGKIVGAKPKKKK